MLSITFKRVDKCESDPNRCPQFNCESECCDGFTLDGDDDDVCVPKNYTNYYVKYKRNTDPTMVISSAIVGVLFIILIVMALAMYRLCKKRRQLNSTGGRSNSQVTRSATAQRETHDNRVFTIYNNDPPPYDIATYDKLPDYSPPTFPPSYEEVQSSPQINFGEDNLVCSITESSHEEPDEVSSPSHMLVDSSQESNTGKHVNILSKTTENNTSVQQSLQRDLHPTVHGNMQLDHVNLQINSNSIQTDI
ncbi:unnamed protein product [Mytilus coruscus]|uniref:Uncharacterized protein n=1 Tax=Mytilus coruscus TaxID=42192 RepID=A0A6J8D5Z1_MYTCO|nr:unnamed protein product [Mytilus coruscus]